MPVTRLLAPGARLTVLFSSEFEGLCSATQADVDASQRAGLLCQGHSAADEDVCSSDRPAHAASYNHDATAFEVRSISLHTQLNDENGTVAAAGLCWVH